MMSAKPLPCSECGKLPHVGHHVDGNFDHWIIECKSGCSKRYIHDESMSGWFITFPWRDLKDAVEEWNNAVKCNNGVKQRALIL